MNLPEYSAPTGYTSGFPIPSVTIGTFNYVIPVGETIVAATYSSYWGNSTFPNSAGADIRLGGVLVGSCAAFAPCDTSTSVTPFSYTFTAPEFSALAGGSASLTAVQTSGIILKLGFSNLTITTRAGVPGPAATPEPASMAMLGAGLVSLGLLRKRFVRS